MEPLLLPRVLLEQPPYARALLRGTSAHPALYGETLFFPFQSGSLLLVRVTGLPDGFHGFHIHETGDCTHDGAEGDFHHAGGHFNPAGVPHPSHAGDLPTLLATNGLAYAILYTGRFHPHDVIDRAVILHALPDDYRTQPAGDSGARIACGVVERVAQQRT